MVDYEPFYMYLFDTAGGLRVYKGSEKWSKLTDIRFLGSFRTFSYQLSRKYTHFLVVQICGGFKGVGGGLRSKTQVGLK